MKNGSGGLHLVSEDSRARSNVYTRRVLQKEPCDPFENMEIATSFTILVAAQAGIPSEIQSSQAAALVREQPTHFPCRPSATERLAGSQRVSHHSRGPGHVLRRIFLAAARPRTAAAARTRPTHVMRCERCFRQVPGPHLAASRRGCGCPRSSHAQAMPCSALQGCLPGTWRSLRAGRSRSRPQPAIWQCRVGPRPNLEALEPNSRRQALAWPERPERPEPTRRSAQDQFRGLDAAKVLGAPMHNRRHVTACSRRRAEGPKLAECSPLTVGERLEHRQNTLRRPCKWSKCST